MLLYSSTVRQKGLQQLTSHAFVPISQFLALIKVLQICFIYSSFQNLVKDLDLKTNLNSCNLAILSALVI